MRWKQSLQRTLFFHRFVLVDTHAYEPILQMLRKFIERLKLPFRKDRELRSALYRILGFYPHNIEYYKIAFAHKSQAFRDKKGQLLNNERLEFLGDAVLESVVSDILFHHFEKKHEGFLTSTRSKIVQRESLNKLAKDLGIDKLVQVSTRNSSHNSHIGGNAFEALMGAVYLDKGYKTCQRFIRKQILGRIMDLDGVANKEVNFKSKLLEWCQKNRIQNDFAMKMEDGGKQNEPTFHCTVVIEGVEFGYGKGYSKKEAQQAAAKETLTILRRDESAVDSVFRAKEKRTAMEANEVAVLPKIEEIEEALLQEKQQSKKAAPSVVAPAPAKKNERTARESVRPEQEEVRAQREDKRPKREDTREAKQPERSEQKEVRSEQNSERPGPKNERSEPKNERSEQKERPAKPVNAAPAKGDVSATTPVKPAKVEAPVGTPVEVAAKPAKVTSVALAEAAIADAESRMYPVVEAPQRNTLPAVQDVQPMLDDVKSDAENVEVEPTEAKSEAKKPRRKRHQVRALEEFTQPKPVVVEADAEASAPATELSKEEKLSRRARRAARLAKAQLAADAVANEAVPAIEEAPAKAKVAPVPDEAKPEVGNLPVAKQAGAPVSDEAEAAPDAGRPKMSRAEQRRNKRNRIKAEAMAEQQISVDAPAEVAATSVEANDAPDAPNVPKTDLRATSSRKKHQSGNSRMRRRMQAQAATQAEETVVETND